MSGPGGFATGDQKVALMAGAIDRPGHFPTATPVACYLVGHLGRHPQCDLNFGAFGEGSVGEEKDPARTEILGESDAFERFCDLSERQRKKIGKPLPDTAFNSN